MHYNSFFSNIRKKISRPALDKWLYLQLLMIVYLQSLVSSAFISTGKQSRQVQLRPLHQHFHVEKTFPSGQNFKTSLPFKAK